MKEGDIKVTNNDGGILYGGRVDVTFAISRSSECYASLLSYFRHKSSPCVDIS